ncbi:hypothetical protein WJX74_007714 [Apatococcus lobatus]|uniref:Ubiquitin-like protease family profile domain-containing protein n=1 Tax=Apatococcus lobatus TaxID=904363 RepID=A0AAW1QX71_9CHLO
MKNVFAKAFTNISSLFTPPGLKKRSRLEHCEASQSETAGPAKKFAKTRHQASASQAYPLPEPDFAKQSGHTASGLPLSRPAICPVESSPEPLQLERPSQHTTQHRQRQQAQPAAQQQVKAGVQHSSQRIARAQPAWQVTPQNPSPLSKITYADGDESTFGSNFTVEGSGLRHLEDEPGSCGHTAHACAPAVQRQSMMQENASMSQPKQQQQVSATPDTAARQERAKYQQQLNAHRRAPLETAASSPAAQGLAAIFDTAMNGVEPFVELEDTPAKAEAFPLPAGPQYTDQTPQTSAAHQPAKPQSRPDTPGPTSAHTGLTLSQRDAGASASPFSFHRPPLGPDGWPLPPTQLPDTPEAVRGQHHAESPSPQGTPSDVGQLAIWAQPAMTPQNQVANSRLSQMTPWTGTGYVGPMGRSIQRASGLLHEMSRQEAADRETLKRREDERQASKQALDSYLVGDHIEKLLARCAQMDIGADEGRRSLAERQQEHEALMAADLEQSARAFQTRREVHESGRKQRSYALSHPAPPEQRSTKRSGVGHGPQSLLPSKAAVALEAEHDDRYAHRGLGRGAGAAVARATAANFKPFGNGFAKNGAVLPAEDEAGVVDLLDSDDEEGASVEDEAGSEEQAQASYSAEQSQGSNLEEQSDSYERYSSENAAESLEQEFDPRIDDDQEDDSRETLGRRRLRLSSKQLRQYREAMRRYDDDRAAEILVTHANIDMTRRHIACLHSLTWLNDEVINMYMALLQEREVRGREVGRRPTCHFFNSFWLPALVGPNHDQYNYPKVSRWTSLKKLRRSAQTAECVLDLERLIVPVHLGMHWTCAVIDLEHRQIRYYDSMAGHEERLMEALRRWVSDEYKDKKNQEVDTSGWPIRHMTDEEEIPQQFNGSDCGVFALEFAERQSRNAAMDFQQRDMDVLRKRVVIDLLAEHVV